MGFKFIDESKNITYFNGKPHIRLKDGGVKAADITRQYWKLSADARKTIQDDLGSFRFHYGEDMTFAKFVNRIFLNYADKAESSVIRRMDELKATRKLNDKDYNMVAEIFKKYISDKYLSRNAHQCNERFRKETIAYMEKCGEEMVYGERSPGVYFQAVLEEYASLSNPKRALIVNKHIYEDIIEAYEKGRRIEAEINGYDKFEKHIVIPVREPQVDRNGYAYYFVGAEMYEENGKTRFKPYSVNFSRIRSITGAGKRYEPLTDEETKEFENVKKIIAEKEEKADVPFLKDEIKRIKVAFTDSGVKKLKNITHNRPFFYDKETAEYNGKTIYEFHCTEAQLEYYLHKLGADAVVSETSAELRERLRKYYADALNAYTEDKKD